MDSLGHFWSSLKPLLVLWAEWKSQGNLMWQEERALGYPIPTLRPTKEGGDVRTLLCVDTLTPIGCEASVCAHV